MEGMTSRALTPWWRSRQPSGAASGADGSVAPTPILDHASPAVRALLAELRLAEPDGAARALLLRAHGAIASRVRAVYAVDDAQPASRTLARGRGSCSQRLAVLEAVARADGTPTRVRGLLIDGRFWYPRFPRLRFAVPDAVLLAWPEFLLDGMWTGAEELFGSVGALSADGGFTNAGGGFTNADGETLFDALGRTAVDWDGATSTPEQCSACDLSGQVLLDLGRFGSRDDLFAAHGQTLCWSARTAADPVLSRWSAGASARAS